MSKQANKCFEQSLRSAVRRLARGNFEDSIREVIDHHHDLMQEELSNGKSEADSEITASQRIGLVGGIARKIVDSPARLTTGKRLQFVGIALWVLVPILLEYLSLFASQLPYPYSSYIGGVFPRAYSTILVGGLVTAIGWFSSAKIEGKAIAIGSLCLVLMGIRFSIIMESQTGSPYSAHVVMMIIRARFASFLIGLGVGAAILRLYHYRIDTFKLRRI